MKLPNRENAYIPPPKLKEYLLSETHPIGRSKAKLLRAVGFDEVNVNILGERLLAIAHSEDVKEIVSSLRMARNTSLKERFRGRLGTPCRLKQFGLSRQVKIAHAS